MIASVRNSKKLYGWKRSNKDAVPESNYKQMGRSQAVKAPGFDPGIRRFESSRPSQIIAYIDKEVEKNISNHRTGTKKCLISLKFFLEMPTL